jgi:hypothetical protein
MAQQAENITRRDFLTMFTIGGFFFISGGNALSGETASPIPRLNPGFRVHVVSKTELHLVTNKGNGETAAFRLHDAEALLIRMIHAGESKEDIILAAARTFGVPMNQAKAKVNQILKQFHESKLIYYGDKMIVKIAESDHGR